MPRKNHFSPKFANKAWRSKGNYKHYFKDQSSGDIKIGSKGWRAWGRKSGLWLNEVEDNLAYKLENDASQIYTKLSNLQELDADERKKWAQFILSQIVRTPTFMRYEKFAARNFLESIAPEHDRVGCEKCGDIYWLTQRNWFLVASNENNFFVRTDNPVLLTGFIDRPKSVLLYPISPRLMWVAASMPDNWAIDWRNGHRGTLNGYEAPNLMITLINFYMISAAQNEFVSHFNYEADYIKEMTKDVLGLYPQPPFSLHMLNHENESDAFESIRSIMSVCDNTNHPAWTLDEIEPFYGIIAK